jgi:hypothetical protein
MAGDSTAMIMGSLATNAVNYSQSGKTPKGTEAKDIAALDAEAKQLNQFAAMTAGAEMGLNLGSLVEAKAKTDALDFQYLMEEKRFQFNKQLAEEQKRDLASIAEDEKEVNQLRIAELLGAQKVAAAGSGVDVEGEQAQALQKDARKAKIESTMRIETNLVKRSLGIDHSVLDEELWLGFQKLQTKQKKRETLTTGGVNAAAGVLSGYNKYMKTKKKK